MLNNTITWQLIQLIVLSAALSLALSDFQSFGWYFSFEASSLLQIR